MSRWQLIVQSGQLRTDPTLVRAKKWTYSSRNTQKAKESYYLQYVTLELASCGNRSPKFLERATTTTKASPGLGQEGIPGVRAAVSIRLATQKGQSEPAPSSFAKHSPLLILTNTVSVSSTPRVKTTLQRRYYIHCTRCGKNKRWRINSLADFSFGNERATASRSPKSCGPHNKLKSLSPTE